MRLAIVLGCLWLACGRPAIPPSLEVQYSAELLAAEESGRSCQEAVANVAAVESRWAAVFAKYGRPTAPAPQLVCR